MAEVFATVVNVKHAKRAQDFGTDAVIATGQEAAAHGEDVTSLVLIPHLAENLKIPVIAAGGFADGRGIAAALALGAEGVAMGTRLMTTKESPLHENYKKLTQEKDVYDTLFSKRFDGILCRVMKTDAAKKALKTGLNWPAAFFNSQDIAKQMNLPYFKLFLACWLPVTQTRSNWPTWRTLLRPFALPRKTAIPKQACCRSVSHRG